MLSAERRAARAVAAPDGNRSLPAPPAGPLAGRQERPAAEDCNESAGFGKDPTIVVRPPRTVLVEDSEATAHHEALDELTSSQPPRPTTGLRVASALPTRAALAPMQSGGDLGGCLGCAKDNDGHRRSTTVCPDFGMTSADRSDQTPPGPLVRRCQAMCQLSCSRSHAGVDWCGGMDYKRYDDSGRPASEKA